MSRKNGKLTMTEHKHTERMEKGVLVRIAHFSAGRVPGTIFLSTLRVRTSRLADETYDVTPLVGTFFD